ncbi:MAG: hypothetical protein ACLU2Y_13025 [Blautia massiliensis (ex Durand et al. 2017)]|uniref:hypothetical protein n=1 Tax=Blautia massiliensis (ex Durand et al. 2017) TaxID=1737424 RepID=UPI00399C981E
MSLQFIIGSSGSGKSCYAYQNIIEQAGLHPDRLYYVIVPEQFTMQTQKTLVEMSPGKGILNIDILSFERLAYRVLEEVGGDSRALLEETGKSMDASENGPAAWQRSLLSWRTDAQGRISG